MIIIDTREQYEEEQYFKNHDIEYRKESLPCGDYAAEDSNGNRVVIERKEIKDYISSLFEGRLDDQMARLAQEDCPILFISGELQEYYDAVPGESRFSKSQFYGSISACIVRYGLRCVVWNQCECSHEETLGIIVKVLEQTSMGHIDKIPKRKKREFNNQIGFLRELTGCPQDTAIELLKFYGTVRKVIEAPLEALKGFKGMGPKRLARIGMLLDE
jgi:DNA excision repair protein ERCC-4